MKIIKKHLFEISLKTEWFPISLILLAFFSSFWFFYLFPSTTPSSWGLAGQINNYSPAWLSAFLLPIASVFIYLLFIVLPIYDPKLKNAQDFAHTYHQLKDIVIVFLLSIYFLNSFTILGYPIDMTLWALLLTALLFFYLALILPKLPINWFFGIRTPWTLSSSLVWKKTHLLSRKLFLFSSFLIALSSISPSYIKSFLLFTSLFLVIFIPFFYSLILYRKKKRKRFNIFSSSAYSRDR